MIKLGKLIKGSVVMLVEDQRWPSYVELRGYKSKVQNEKIEQG